LAPVGAIDLIDATTFPMRIRTTMNIRTLLIFCCTLFLIACGGNPDTAQPQAALRQATTTQNTQANVSDYRTVVAQVYLAYFGRPADPDGLLFFSQVLHRIAAPTNIVDLNKAYDTNVALRSTIDSFGTSQESMDLYPGDNTAFVTAIYRNLFSRTPDAGGQAFWLDGLNTNRLTRARAAIALMAGSQTTDITVINNKTQVGLNFTTGVTTGYDTLAAAATARQLIANVQLGTDIAAYQTTVNTTLASLVEAAARNNYPQVAAIMKKHCTPCHSATPTFPGFTRAPRGVTYDTSAEIHADANTINQVAGTSTFMPLNNVTNMTSDERAVIRSWIALGAP
jgi:Domain of unknown function (DUF4214)